MIRAKVNKKAKDTGLREDEVMYLFPLEKRTDSVYASRFPNVLSHTGTFPIECFTIMQDMEIQDPSPNKEEQAQRPDSSTVEEIEQLSLF